MASSSESVVIDSVVAFLRDVPPFQFLSIPDLTRLSRCMTLEFFPKDTIIFSAGHPASESLYVVHKGGVKLALRSQVGKQFVLDMRSEGEIFGLLSVMSKDLARFDVTAIEDTLCYCIPAEQVERMIASNADVANYLLRLSVTRYMDRSLQELRTQTSLMGDTERLLYSLAVSDVPTSPVLVCPEDCTVRGAARFIAKSKATCLFVVDGSGAAVGIVTDRDFATKVVAESFSGERKVTEIMSQPVISVDAGERLFHALLAMVSRNIHHVLVTREGTPTSVLTAHDLMVLQGKSPLNVVRYVEEQTNIEDLACAQNRINALLPLLLREGAKASHVTRVIAEINDRVIAKILQFAEAKLGPPPVPYCWLAAGSEGRREQTFKTDQDNCLLYANSDDPSGAGYFSDLASFVYDALATCGYPPCPGNFMASNPRWRQPLSAWMMYFHAWINEADLHGTEDALVFFDMRPVVGDFSLFQKLSAPTFDQLKNAATFKSVMAAISTNQKPPLGFFRNFVVERSGEHRNQLDLKMFGTAPIVGAARIFALDAGIEDTNTSDRLLSLASSSEKDSTIFQDLHEAFEFLTLLRIEYQLQQVRDGQSLNNYVDPEALTHLQRSLLKEAFRTIMRAQALVEDKFRTAIWSQLGR